MFRLQGSLIFHPNPLPDVSQSSGADGSFLFPWALLKLPRYSNCSRHFKFLIEVIISTHSLYQHLVEESTILLTVGSPDETPPHNCSTLRKHFVPGEEIKNCLEENLTLKSKNVVEKIIPLL